MRFYVTEKNHVFFLSFWLCVASVPISASTKELAEELLLEGDNRDEGRVTDIRFFQTQYSKLHKDLFFLQSKEDFDKQVEALIEKIPGLSDMEICVSLQRIVAAAGDAHSDVYIHDKINTSFPFTINKFGKDYHVIGVLINKAENQYEYEKILYCKLVQINGIEMSYVENILKTVITNDYNSSQNWYEYNITPYFTPEILACLGIPINDTNTFTFVDESSIAFDLDIRTFSLDRLRDWDAILNTDLPLYLSNLDQNYWYQYLEDERVLYLCYNSCWEMDDKPYADFLLEMAEQTRDKAVDKFIIDLRNNKGGMAGLNTILYGSLNQYFWVVLSSV